MNYFLCDKNPRRRWWRQNPPIRASRFIFCQSGPTKQYTKLLIMLAAINKTTCGCFYNAKNTLLWVGFALKDECPESRQERECLGNNVCSSRYCHRLAAQLTWHHFQSPTFNTSHKGTIESCSGQIFLYKVENVHPSMKAPTLLCQGLPSSIMTNVKSLLRHITRLLKRAMTLLEKRKTRRLPVSSVHIMTWSWRTTTKRFLLKPIRKSCCSLENFYTRLILIPVPSLKTLGRGIPKIVSLFEPVKLLVANTDKHELCQSEELPEAEFDSLDEDEITQLKRR